LDVEEIKDTSLGRKIAAFVERSFIKSLKESLRGVYIKGEIPKGPMVLAMNHHSYFDGHLMGFLAKLEGQKFNILVLEENLKAFPVLKLVGALEANRLREALKGSRWENGWDLSRREDVLPWTLRSPQAGGSLAC